MSAFDWIFVTKYNRVDAVSVHVVSVWNLTTVSVKDINVVWQLLNVWINRDTIRRLTGGHWECLSTKWQQAIHRSLLISQYKSTKRLYLARYGSISTSTPGAFIYFFTCFCLLSSGGADFWKTGCTACHLLLLSSLIRSPEAPRSSQRPVVSRRCIKVHN